MTAIKIGISGYPYDRDRYRASFATVELGVGRLSPPTPRTLRRWQREAEDTRPDFEHTWVAWHSFTHLHAEMRAGRPLDLDDGESAGARGHFQDTPENRRVWAEVRAQAEAAGARVMVLETPASFTPSRPNVERVRAFGEWSALPDGMRIAWDPSGFWDREELLALCTELEWSLVIDPLLEPDEPMPPTEAPLYLRMRGTQGLGGNYGDYDLERLAEFVESYERAWVIFGNEQALRDATRCAELLGLEAGDVDSQPNAESEPEIGDNS